jgi:hypothetical protein
MLEIISNCGGQTADGTEDELGIDKGSEDRINDGFEEPGVKAWFRARH